MFLKGSGNKVADITSKSTLVQKAYDTIKEKIIYLELLPGQIVSDYILSKELNMSRTPIKQALLELRRDGLLDDATAGKGYEVSKITAEEVADLFDAREGLETMALKIALKKGISKKDIDELTLFNKKISQADNTNRLKDVFYYDQELHTKLVSLSKNKRIIEFNNTLLLQLIRMRFLTYFEPSLPGMAVKEHISLIDSIVKGDENKAINILTDHIRYTKDSYISILTTKIRSEEYGALKFLMRKENQL
ncbi:MAG: GntR family transcriptional regulator [Firmicutes bacterium]|nr:GntR family transcriptional regulator [Bacillota bacterium]